jgi:hypothetical protein
MAHPRKYHVSLNLCRSTNPLAPPLALTARRRPNPSSPDGFRPGREPKSAGEIVSSSPSPIDESLGFLIDAWPSLPEAVRAGIVAMVEASAPKK